MTYSEQYKQELQEATALQKRLEEEYNEFHAKVAPLIKEDLQRKDQIVELKYKIKDLRHELRNAWLLENFDEDGMFVEGINV